METWKRSTINSNYNISNDGRIRRNGSEKDHSMRDNDGYLVTDLYMNGKRSTERVHRLVAIEFVPNPDGKPEVNHRDGNKHNNAASNLEWVTKKENCRHAWDNGLARPSYGGLGRHNHRSGRPGKPFRIVETGEIFNRLKDCEEAIGADGGHINDCLRGRQETHRGYHFEYV